MKKCSKCRAEIGSFGSECYNLNGDLLCLWCWKKLSDKERRLTEHIGSKEDYAKEKFRLLKEAKSLESDKKRQESLSPNERKVEEEIAKLEGGSGAVVVLIILGILGLFFFLLPGILFFVWAAILSSSRKSKATSLRAQLESLRQSKSTKLHSKTNDKENPLKILKNRFAKGEISEEEYIKKKQILNK